jgi:hypothetical protein
MPRIWDKTCNRYFTVSSKVRVGKVGSKRWKSYCARSAGIKDSGKCSKNQAQRRRWKC